MLDKEQIKRNKRVDSTITILDNEKRRVVIRRIKKDSLGNSKYTIELDFDTCKELGLPVTYVFANTGHYVYIDGGPTFERGL